MKKKRHGRKIFRAVLLSAVLSGATVLAEEAEILTEVPLPEESLILEEIQEEPYVRITETTESPEKMQEDASIPENVQEAEIQGQIAQITQTQTERTGDFENIGSGRSAGNSEAAGAENSETSENIGNRRVYLDIDTVHRYEHMDASYSQGYIPKVENDSVYLVVPFLASGPLENSCLSVELDMGENAPFVYANYRKEVKREGFQFGESAEAAEAYVFCCEIALERNRKNGKYPVTVRAVGYSEAGYRAELTSRIFITVADGTDTPAPGQTDAPEPGTENPGQTDAPEPGTENEPGQTDAPGPGTENEPGQTDAPEPGTENEPGQTDAQEPGTEKEPGQTDAPEPETENKPGQTDAQEPGTEKEPEQTNEPEPGTEDEPGQTDTPEPGTEAPPDIVPDDPAQSEQPDTGEPSTETQNTEPLTEEPLTEEPSTEEPLTEEPLTEEPDTEDSLPEDLGSGDGGGGYYSGGSYGGGGGSSAGYGGSTERVHRQPKFLLISNSLDGEQLTAGQEYEFMTVFQNMTGDEPVYNMKVTLKTESEALDFGCSSFYFGKVRTQETVSLPTYLSVKPNAQAGKAAVTFAFEYENDQGTAYTAAEEVELDIYQPSQVVLEGFRLSPRVYSTDTVEGSFAVHNAGKAAVYNVKIDFAGQGLFAVGSVFAGNLEAGASYDGELRIYVGNKTMESLGDAGTSGKATPGGADAGDNFSGGLEKDDGNTENSGNAGQSSIAESGNDANEMYGQTTGTLTLTYEDAYGEVYTQTQEFATEILEPQVVKLSVEKPEEQTNQWQAAVLTLTGVVFLLTLIFMGWRLRRSKNALADLLAAQRERNT